MIRRPRVAVSSSVQSGRMFGSKAFTYVPSVTEGVLDSAERGGYRQGPGTAATPLDQKSLRRHPTSGRPVRPRLAIAVPLSANSRILSAMSWPPRLTRLQPNVFRLDRVDAGC